MTRTFIEFFARVAPKRAVAFKSQRLTIEGRRQ